MHKFGIALATAALPLFLSCFEVDIGKARSAADTPIRWYSVLSHSAAGTLALEIADNGSFTEPRQSGVFYIKVVLPEPIPTGIIGNANIDFKGDNGSAFYPPFTALQDGVDLRVIWIYTAGMADMARYRIRLKNGSGETLSERRFSRLTGDVVMDDAVDPSDSAQILAFTSGTVPDSTNVPGIRADLDHNGSIDNNDQILWGSFSGNDIMLISYPAFP